jgi:hypothetical protein
MSGSGRRNRGRGRSHGRGRKNKSDLSITKQQSKGAAPLLGLGDHVYDVGDPTNAGNFVKISRFLMTYIGKTYDHGARIAQSLEEKRIVDELLPQHQQSTSTDKQVAERENEQYKEINCLKLKAYVDADTQSKLQMNKVYGLCMFSQ